jgi:hypothetical protein
MVVKAKVCGFRSEGRICTLLYAAGRWVAGVGRYGIYYLADGYLLKQHLPCRLGYYGFLFPLAFRSVLINGAKRSFKALGVKKGFARCFAQRVAGGWGRTLKDVFIWLAVMVGFGG